MITLQDTLVEIRSLHRKRIFMMNQRKRIDLELGAFLRMELGWRKQLPKAKRDAINDRALEMIMIGERYIKASERAAAKAKRQNLPVPAPAPLPDEFGDLGDLIVTTIGNRRPCNLLEDEATHEMEKLAQNLPIYEWAMATPGFGALGLAIIIAEAGRDLNDYGTVAKLWTRMGVGLRDGIRQGNLPKNAPKEQWVTHAYNRERRSRIWTIGSSLVKMNKDANGEPAYYRQTYLDRKAYERARAEANGLKVAPAGSIPKGKASEYMSLGHIDKRAQRYMEKRLLRNLWVAWRERATYRV